MSFFHNLNKRLADLASKQDARQITESAQAETVARSPLTQALNEADYSAKRAAAGKDIGKPGKNFAKIAKGAAERYGSKAAGERVAGAVLNKLRHKTNEDHCSACDCSPCECKKMDEAEAGPHTETKLVRDLRAKGLSDKEIRKEIERIYSSKSYPVKEDGMPAMTPKQKSFAKLAPPADKITFADKIAGAKKEVDEMLGDVAADAMRKAIGGHGEAVDEGFGEMDAWLKSREKEKGTGNFDVHDTGYSKRYTRRAPEAGMDKDTADSDTPKKKGRPKGPAKGPERVTGKSYKYKNGRPAKANEDAQDPADQGEYDQEGESAKCDIKTIVRHAQALHKILNDNDNLPEWVQSKLAKIEGMMTSVDDYMQNHADHSDQQAIAEKAKPKGARPDFLDMDKDGDKKEPMKKAVADKKQSGDTKPAFLKKGKDTDTKEEKVEETTTAGSVATADAAPKAAKGMQFGKGVYEGLSSRLENIINEGMSINVSVDEQGKKTVSVNATDADADALADLLKMSGMQAQEQECASCGQAPCGCIDENAPDYPTNTETSDNPFQYSGGLNGPKSTGQATVPVVASQLRRQVSMEENVELERNLFKTWKNYKG
jgi:hypothetical protein